MPEPYTGGCQCGQVRYELSGEPIRLIACHCTECQRQSGSAFGMSMLIKKEDLKLSPVLQKVLFGLPIVVTKTPVYSVQTVEYVFIILHITFTVC